MTEPSRSSEPRAADKLIRRFDPARERVPRPMSDIVPFGDTLPLDSAQNDGEQLLARVELGRARVRLEDAACMGVGTVTRLDRRAHDLVEVTIAGRIVARGEVVAVDGKFCVRVTELLNVAKAA